MELIESGELYLLDYIVKIDLWKWANDPFFSSKPPNKKDHINSSKI
ncbi:hypothetical protein [Sphingobacterium litopenaei]|nr:hypothetical protein [Sphingobacterium litopenaei]